MEHIRAIQELVDAHKEDMPTGVVVDVMEQCQAAFKALPKLWKVSFAHVVVDCDNELIVSEKTMIVSRKWLSAIARAAAYPGPTYWILPRSRRPRCTISSMTAMESKAVALHVS